MSASVRFAAVVLAGVGACYTGPINMAPRIDDILAIDPLKRGSDIAFSAVVSDPDNDNDPLTVTWSHFKGDCSQMPDDLRTLAMGMTYRVPGTDTLREFCVRATVTDRYGATDTEPRLIRPGNQPPLVQLVVEGEDIRSGAWSAQEPFALFRWIRFDATGTTDPDDGAGLEFDWVLETPDGTLMPCPDSIVPQEASICAQPTAPGPLTVRLTVRDPMGEEMSVTRTVVVAEDAFPCLAQTMPSLAETIVSSAPEQDQDFRVLRVVDDGESYPTGNPDQTTFRWFLARGDGPFERQEGTGAYFNVPAGRFFLGEQARVRVEIADRNVMRSEQALDDCEEKDICAIAPQCRQRMTWLIDYRQ